MKKKGSMRVQHFCFMFLEDGDMYRVWRNDWYGDQFEVLNEEEFNNLKTLCKRFSLGLQAPVEAYE